MVFYVTDENKELLEKYDGVFNGIMSKIKKVDDDWLEYSKGYKKIKFSSDDNLPLKKPLKFHNMTVTIRCLFGEDNKLYPEVFLDGALYSLYKCWNMIELILQKELALIRQINQENVRFGRNERYYLHKNFSYGPFTCDGCYAIVERSTDFKNIAIFHVNKTACRVYFKDISKIKQRS